MNTHHDHAPVSDLDIPLSGTNEIADSPESVDREFPLADWRRLAVESGWQERFEGDYPVSVLDMYVGSGGRGDYHKLLKKVHGLDLFRDSFSSRTVDSL